MLNIKDLETDRLVREGARKANLSITEFVKLSAKTYIESLRIHKTEFSIAEQLLGIGRHCSSLPVLDAGIAEDIIGYNSEGFVDGN